MKFKVGSRVEVDMADMPNATPPRWKLGRIVGTGRYKNEVCWQVHLDEHKQLLDHVAIPVLTADQYLRHSNAPMPEPETYRPRGSAQTYTPRPRPDLQTSDNLVTPYEPQIGDVLIAGEELVKVLDKNREQVLLERQHGIPVHFSIKYVQSVVTNGQWRHANVTEKIKALSVEADRLDQVAADAIEARAKVIQQLAALRGKSPELVNKEIANKAAFEDVKRNVDSDKYRPLDSFVDGKDA